MKARKLPVFLTVDTEIWPYASGWPQRPLATHEKHLARQFEHCILGTSSEGELGIRYQMFRMNQYGLRATFFVEALHAAVVGDKWLTETIAMIQDAGHDVQLHVHPEWLSGQGDPALPGQHGQYLWQYTLQEQTGLLDWCKRRMQLSGVERIAAFRAGSFGANCDTLRALDAIDVPVDSSYHVAYLGNACMIDAPEKLYQKCKLGNTIEIPMTVFTDYPGHFRPVQLAACSCAEIEATLMQAWRRGWDSFVILWHGQELLHAHFRTLSAPGQVSPVVVQRFEQLCRFLSRHADKFETVCFNDVVGRVSARPEKTPPLKSTPARTAHRMMQQVVARYL